MEAPERIEIEEEQIHDRFSRAVAVAIVLVTLLVAVVHFAQSYDEERASDAAINAQQLAILGNGQQAAILQDAGAQFGLFALSEEQRTREANSLQQQLNEIATNVITPQETARLTQDSQRWSQLAAATEGLTALKSGGPEGPQQDASFPSRFLIDKLVELDQLRAERDAVNQIGQDWNNKVTAYAAVLTLTAVALYLLGLSIALKLRIRLGLAGLGAGFAAIALVATLVIQAVPPSESPPQAAVEYAEGLKEFQIAAASSDIAGFKASAQHLRRATELRPRFALAYEKLALAEFSAGAPSPGAIGEVASADALNRSEADLMTAKDLGDNSAAMLLALGAVEYHLWLKDGRTSRIDDFLKYESQAEGMDNAGYTAPANLALGLLAVGRDSDARAAYRESIVRLLKLHNAVFSEFGVAESLNSLETLVKAKPETAGRVQKMKEYLTNAAAQESPDPSTGPSRTAAAVGISVNAGSLDWHASIAGFQHGSDHVSVQWYYRDPAGIAWAPLPAASGSYTELPPFSSLGADGYGQRNAFLGASGDCLHDGTYRVEIYINGKFGGKVEREFKLGDLKGHLFLDVGAATCVPTDWKQTTYAVRGFENGYTSPSKDAGMFVFRYQDAKVGGSASALTNSSNYLALTMAAFNDHFPAPPVFERISPSLFFQNLDGPTVQYYTYPGGTVQVGAGVKQADGSVLVGVVYGPSSSFEAGGSSPAIFDSLVQHY
jgi:hypothetical protein